MDYKIVSKLCESLIHIELQQFFILL